MTIVREGVLADEGATPAEIPDVDSVEQYLGDRTKELDADVLAGLRELESADSISWYISRQGDDNPERNGFLAKWNTAQLTAENLRNKFGGGKYYVKGLYPGGKYAAHRKFEIATDAPRLAGAAVNASTPAQTFDVQRFMAEQEAREEARAEKRRARLMETITIVGPIVAPIIAAMIGNKGPDITGLVAALKGPTMPEMMQGLASLKALAPEQTADPFDRAFKIMEKVQDLSGSAAGETGWMDVLKEIVRAAGPTVGTVIEGAVQSAMTRAPALPASVAAPVGGNVSVPVVSNAAPVATDSPMLSLLPWLKSHLENSLKKAQKNVDPGLVAEWIINDIPEHQDPEQLIAFVSREDWWTWLQRLEPRVAPFQGWYAQLRQAMLDGFVGEGDEPTASTMVVKPHTDPPVIDKPSGGPPDLGAPQK